MNKLSALALSSLATTMLSGCSSWQSITLGSENPCPALKSVIADYPSGFQSFRGKASHFNVMTVYAAKEELVNGHCEIWAWDQSDAAYSCTVAAPNADVANQRQEKTNQFVAACLGDDWHSETRERTRDNEPTGTATRYSREGTPAVVSVHSIVRSNGPGERRLTSLYIGSPDRVDELTR